MGTPGRNITVEGYVYDPAIDGAPYMVGPLGNPSKATARTEEEFQQQSDIFSQWNRDMGLTGSDGGNLLEGSVTSYALDYFKAQALGEPLPDFTALADAGLSPTIQASAAGPTSSSSSSSGPDVKKLALAAAAVVAVLVLFFLMRR